MSKGLFQLLPLIIICLVSCNKEETPPQNSDEQLLKTGTTENMLLITYDSVARACDKYLEGFTLDLNNDHVDDLKISGIMPVYYTTDWVADISIYCLNREVEILGYQAMDTIYTYTNSYYNDTNLYITNYYNCFQTHNSDSIIEINASFRARYFVYDELIDSEATFESDTIVLTKSSLYHPAPPDEGVHYATDEYNNNCYNFPIDEVMYLAFRIKDKLGWLRMSIYNGCIVTVYESAIQQ